MPLPASAGLVPLPPASTAGLQDSASSADHSQAMKSVLITAGTAMAVALVSATAPLGALGILPGIPAWGPAYDAARHAGVSGLPTPTATPNIPLVETPAAAPTMASPRAPAAGAPTSAPTAGPQTMPPPPPPPPQAAQPTPPPPPPAGPPPDRPPRNP